MTTRFDAHLDPGAGSEITARLPTGYENQPSETVFIPGCGVKDVDVGVFRLFERGIGFRTHQVPSNTTTSGLVDVSKPHVVFATGERFAMAKQLRPFRDKNKTLVLPLIAVRRTGLEMTQEDVGGRGMNQASGALVLKRKLDRVTDRPFQSLLNRFGLKNVEGPGTTRTTAHDLRNSNAAQVGALLDPGVLGNETNVWEILVVPQPRFFTATYEVVYWTQYEGHMSYLLDTTLSSFLPQGRDWKIDTDAGWWFTASVEDQFRSDDNSEEWAEKERVRRVSFSVRVKGYVFGTSGDQVPVRRYLSSPSVVFETLAVQDQVLDREALTRPPHHAEEDGVFVLNDPEEAKTETSKKTSTLSRTLQKKVVTDPLTGKQRVRYISIDNAGKRRGETVYSASDPDALGDLLVPG